MDMIAIFRAVTERNKERIANIKADQLDDPTPCNDWKVRELLNHVIGENLLFGMRAAGEEVDSSQTPPDFASQASFSDIYNAAADKHIAGWAIDGVMERSFALPFGTMPGKDAFRIALLEAVVHGWDIAKATGQDTSIPDELAAPMLSGTKKTIPPGTRPPGMPFGPEVQVPETASLGDQLVAYLGRQP